MTERKPHPDNALIDEMEQEGAVGQQGTSGGNVARTVGARSEEHGATEDPGVERATGKDNPAENAAKGEKTIEKLDPAWREPSKG